MKTLLLSLVVAFVYLVPGDTITCHSCTGKLCLGHEKCEEGQNLCFEKTYKNDMLGMRTVRGCADTCANPGEDEKVTYCGSDKCNC